MQEQDIGLVQKGKIMILGYADNLNISEVNKQNICTVNKLQSRIGTVRERGEDKGYAGGKKAPLEKRREV